MNSDSLKYVLREFVDRELPSSRARTLELPTESGKVIALVGVRRVGKTFLFMETMRRLVQQGVDRRRILYLNFEDDRLHPLVTEELDLVLRCHRELFPNISGQRLYLFLDEVQSAPGWQRWVRRLADTEDIGLFVTGSSSQLLTSDLSSAMRGRSVSFEVFPLSFREFLAFRGLDAPAHDGRRESDVRAAFAEYLRWGGFPEVVLAEAAMRPLILEEYASLMLQRDLAERHDLRRPELMRNLLRHCYRNTASLLSVTKLERDLRSRGFEFARNTLFDYVRMLEDAGLIFLLPLWTESVRKQARNPKKLHVVDTGLVAAFLPGAERDVGHKLETAVFLECRRRGRDWRYLGGDGEVDLCDGEGRLFVNCCWDLGEPGTVQRERAAMVHARRAMPQARGWLLFHEHLPETSAELDAAVPAWQWLLGDAPGPAAELASPNV